MRIAIHVLKASLSRYVAQARAGEVIEITSHDKPVARLIGVPPIAQDGLRRLIARGAAQWGGGKTALHHPMPMSGRGKSVSEIVLEDRG